MTDKEAKHMNVGGEDPLLRLLIRVKRTTMSRIGKAPVADPIRSHRYCRTASVMKVKGPKGELNTPFDPIIAVEVERRRSVV